MSDLTKDARAFNNAMLLKAISDFVELSMDADVVQNSSRECSDLVSRRSSRERMLRMILDEDGHMSVLQERALRVNLKFPLSIVIDGERIRGICENLSETGLLGTFSRELDVWTTGELDLHFGTDLVDVKVRIARSIGLQAGLNFLTVTEHDKQELRMLIDSVRQGKSLPEHLVEGR